MKGFGGRLIAVLFALSLIPNVSAQEPALRLLTEENPPFNYRNKETGEIMGGAVDLVREIMNRAGVQYDIELMPWRRAYRQAQKETNSCAFIMTVTEEREQLFEFVTPLFVGGWAFFRKKGDTELPVDVADIRGDIIVAENAFGILPDLEALPDVTVLKAPSEAVAYRMLMRGRGDFWLAGKKAYGRVNANYMQRNTIEIAHNWKPVVIGMGCSRATDQGLLARLRAANQSIGDRRYSIVHQMEKKGATFDGNP